MEKSKFVKYHVPCPECDSSDAASINEDGSLKCFSCGVFIPNKKNKVIMNTNVKQQHDNISDKHGGIFAPLTDRNISQETATKFGVKTVYDSNGVIAQHLYPYYNQGELSGVKIRLIRDKIFRFEGTMQGCSLFGQNLFKHGGKYLTITEGECDAMAAYELMGSKWAVVSIRNGAQSAVKDIKENIEYIESFDNVVICFDKDAQGQEAAKKVANIIKPGKAKIMSLPNGYKDANDMLRKRKHEEFTKSFWDAQSYTPSGIIRVSKKVQSFLKSCLLYTSDAADD